MRKTPDQMAVSIYEAVTRSLAYLESEVSDSEAIGFHLQELFMQAIIEENEEIRRYQGRGLKEDSLYLIESTKALVDVLGTIHRLISIIRKESTR